MIRSVYRRRWSRLIEPPSWERQVQPPRAAADSPRELTILRLAPADRRAPEDRMQRGCAELRDLLVGEALLAGCERDQVLDALSQTAPFVGAVLPQVHAHAVAERRQVQDRKS